MVTKTNRISIHLYLLSTKMATMQLLRCMCIHCVKQIQNSGCLLKCEYIVYKTHLKLILIWKSTTKSTHREQNSPSFYSACINFNYTIFLCERTSKNLWNIQSNLLFYHLKQVLIQCCANEAWNVILFWWLNTFGVLISNSGRKPW